MLGFREWLALQEGRKDLVPPGVLAGYEYAFRQELQKLIGRTQNPSLRAVLTGLLDCPIRTGNRCRGFADYIVGALVRNGLHHRYDVEACLAYIFEKLTMSVTDQGEPRKTVFGDFVELPDYSSGNPLAVRFLKYLEWAIGDIRKGRIPRLAIAERRPPGTVSIRPGRQQDGDPAGGISAGEIAARPSGDADLGRFRRRWLEYPPRDPASGYRNRLEEVLAKMVRDGVLRATKTRNGAVVYEPGARFEEVRRQAVGVD
jgi:hypothetical protein